MKRFGVLFAVALLFAGTSQAVADHHGGKGLPTLRGGDHIGLTVPDLDEAWLFLATSLVAKLFIH